jgi:CheY-like chemotaxis protein
MAGLAGKILRAYGGREAIAIAQKEAPDVIVLDLMMPEVNGFHVVEALSKDPATARIPILVVTAKQITSADRVQLNGAVSIVIEKAEFSAERFSTEVRRALSRRKKGA